MTQRSPDGCVCLCLLALLYAQSQPWYAVAVPLEMPLWEGAVPSCLSYPAVVGFSSVHITSSVPSVLPMNSPVVLYLSKSFNFSRPQKFKLSISHILHIHSITSDTWPIVDHNSYFWMYFLFRKGLSEGEVTLEDREHAKRIVYSVVYGAG